MKNKKFLFGIFVGPALLFLVACQSGGTVQDGISYGEPGQSDLSSGDDFWPEQSASQGAVTISLRPLDLSKDAVSWDFEVTLNTHSVDLSADLLEAAVLIDNAATEHKPVAWDGSGPGGHHRSGVLSFTPFDTEKIMLKIRGVNAAMESDFAWELNR